MMSLLSIAGVWGWFRKSLIAQIVMGVIAFLGVWKINNVMVAKKAVKQVVQASKKAGAKRNAQSREIRSSIKPGTALDRLRKEFADNQ